MTKAISRVPIHLAEDDDHFDFLDSMDRRQLRVAQLTDLASTASTSDIIALVNAILAAHRTK
jgi:hypothetical protein